MLRPECWGSFRVHFRVRPWWPSLIWFLLASCLLLQAREPCPDVCSWYGYRGRDSSDIFFRRRRRSFFPWGRLWIFVSFWVRIILGFRRCYLWRCSSLLKLYIYEVYNQTKGHILLLIQTHHQFAKQEIRSGILEEHVFEDFLVEVSADFAQLGLHFGADVFNQWVWEELFCCWAFRGV